MPEQPTSPEGPPDGWIFEATEVTAGYWEVVGRDPEGHTVDRGGADPTDLLRAAWQAARWVDQQVAAHAKGDAADR